MSNAKVCFALWADCIDGARPAKVLEYPGVGSPLGGGEAMDLADEMVEPRRSIASTLSSQAPRRPTQNQTLLSQQ